MKKMIENLISIVVVIFAVLLSPWLDKDGYEIPDGWDG